MESTLKTDIKKYLLNVEEGSVHLGIEWMEARLTLDGKELEGTLGPLSPEAQKSRMSAERRKELSE